VRPFEYYGIIYRRLLLLRTSKTEATSSKSHAFLAQSQGRTHNEKTDIEQFLVRKIFIMHLNCGETVSEFADDIIPAQSGNCN
jgi:hypothetical protein